MLPLRAERTDVWILDLDGVVWLLDTPIEGSREALDLLRGRGERLAFVTNNSVLTVSSYLDKFERMGIAVSREELVTSSMAAASLLIPGERAYVIGGKGLIEQVSAVAEIVTDEEADERGAAIDAVVVGWDQSFSFAKIRRAMWAIHSGARLIGTNSDPTYPTPEGLIPGAGAVIASVQRAAGTDGVIAGKPNEPIASLVKKMITGDAVMVGDRYSTDGAFAQTLGVPFYLVSSGVKEEIPPQAPQPERIASSLWDLVTTNPED